VSEDRWENVPNEVTIHLGDGTIALWWADTGLARPVRPRGMRVPEQAEVDVEQIDAREGTIVAR
jgi:hypothetical protein